LDPSDQILSNPNVPNLVDKILAKFVFGLRVAVLALGSVDSPLAQSSREGPSPKLKQKAFSCESSDHDGISSNKKAMVKGVSFLV
jgi:hypothetical protein